jgi:hypothetical protein
VVVISGGEVATMAAPLTLVRPSETAGPRTRSGSWPVDDLGPIRVEFLRLPTGQEAIVVVDNLALGPAIGGVRRTSTVDTAEVARLAPGDNGQDHRQPGLPPPVLTTTVRRSP